jgi:SAM-dependent methyltransferase
MSAAADGAVAARQAEALCRLLRLSPGDGVLDVPCGDGRLSVALAACGLAVTAVDKDNEALTVGRQRTGGSRVKWVCSDMAVLPPMAPFDAAVCFWSSFGYLSDDGNELFVQGLARALKPDGRMYLDTPVLETLFRQWTPRSLNQRGKHHILQQRTFDFRTSRLERAWTYFSDGERRQRVTRQRHYSVFELLAMFERAGFVECQLLGDLDGRPFDESSHKLYVVAGRGARAPV